jgi:hypothetical protein
MRENIYRITRPTSFAYDIWSIIAMMMWFGIMFAVCTILIAALLVLIIGAVLMGLIMPSRTVRGQLRSLDANVCAAIEQVRSLKHR